MAAKEYDSLELEHMVKATPQEVYDAWLDSDAHAEMTGSGFAEIIDEEGEEFSAWDDYITGRNLELVPGKRIVQSWRTTEFARTDEDSRLEIHLEPAGAHTKIRLVHTHIPKGQGPNYEKGWHEYYFEPMRSYFPE
jgi:uncharacterized protein YndB with AHSA1/START domain